MKNPYKRLDHRNAFEKVIDLIKSGLAWQEAAKLLSHDIPRETRWQISAKVNRLLKRDKL